MTNRSKKNGAAPVREVYSDDVRDILKDTFFDPNGRSPRVSHRDADQSAEHRVSIHSEPPPKKKPKPEHYKVICISLYNEDLARLDDIVQVLKDRGFTKANRSAVLRAAMEQFDPSKVNKGL